MGVVRARGGWAVGISALRRAAQGVRTSSCSGVEVVNCTSEGRRHLGSGSTSSTSSTSTTTSSSRDSFKVVVGEGDDRPRRVCQSCGFIDYQNPRVVCTSVATWGGEEQGGGGEAAPACSAEEGPRYLLVKRSIAPCKGQWGLPGGFMELGETAEGGAAREAREEAHATLKRQALLAVYSLPRIGQVHLVYSASLASADVSSGQESEAVGLFLWGDIPWEELAFPTVSWALMHHHAAALWRRRHARSAEQQFHAKGSHAIDPAGGESREAVAGAAPGGGPPYGNPCGEDLRRFWSPKGGFYIRAGWELNPPPPPPSPPADA